MIKKFDSWLAKLPSWLGTTIFILIIFLVAFVASFINNMLENDESVEDIPNKYDLDEVVSQYTEDEVKEYFDRYYYDMYSADTVALEDYQELQNENEMLERELNEYIETYGELSDSDFGWDWQSAYETHQKELESRK